MKYIGLDPGANGGIAVIDDDRQCDCWALAKMTEPDIAGVLMVLARPSAYPVFAIIERVHSMPKQGVASTFKFGSSFGFLRGCLTALHIPFELIGPQAWQKALGCLSHGDKNVTKAKAQQLFPNMRVTHATADAILIAEYARRLHRNEPAAVMVP